MKVRKCVVNHPHCATNEMNLKPVGRFLFHNSVTDPVIWKLKRSAISDQKNPNSQEYSSLCCQISSLPGKSPGRMTASSRFFIHECLRLSSHLTCARAFPRVFVWNRCCWHFCARKVITSLSWYWSEVKLFSALSHLVRFSSWTWFYSRETGVTEC